ncbi:unnamed protein product [Urochloa decumbens]|uniref:Uncharacterized protein n=1 Tax=Urochloa decumbens TaxID=240449 RepID=A0ABC8Z1U8_9POAL
MRRVLLLIVVLLCAASLAEARGGSGFRFRGRRFFGGRRSSSDAPSGLSGGTWTACIGSSLLAAAVVLL